MKEENIPDRMQTDNEPRAQTNRLLYALYIGFFAGLIFGLAKILAYYLGFTKIIPAFMAEPFFKHDFLVGWTGHFVGWIYFIMFSLAASLLYVLVLSKFRGPWMGLAYGVIWWAIFHVLIGPPMEMMETLYRQTWSSIVTDFCIFLVRGLFIGYSIAFEFTEERIREPFTNFEDQRTGK